jgi:hypothetical protein
MQRAVILTAVLASALALLGCGGGDGDGDGGSGDERDAVRDIQSVAQETAEAIVLDLSDFPNGWRASASEATQDTNELNKCFGVDYSGLTVTGEAESETFAMGENAEALSESKVYETEQESADASAEYARGLESPGAEDCFSDAIVRAIQENDPDGDYEVGEIDFGELSFTPPRGVEEARVWQIAVPIETQGLSETVYFENAVLREGNLRAALITQDAGDPFDPALRDDLLAVIAARMTEAAS